MAATDGHSRNVPRANTFFALVPPPPVRDAVAGVQARLTPRLPASVRAVAPANFHVTLAFLGALAGDRLDALRDLADGLALSRECWVLDRLGTFPRARVGWLGCGEAPADLAAFQGRLVEGLRGAGFAVDRRPWVPHLTLYRNLRSPMPTINLEPVPWVCDGFTLLRTRSTESGPEYVETGRWTARDAGDSRPPS